MQASTVFPGKDKHIYVLILTSYFVNKNNDLIDVYIDTSDLDRLASQCSMIQCVVRFAI